MFGRQLLMNDCHSDAPDDAPDDGDLFIVQEEATSTTKTNTVFIGDGTDLLMFLIYH